MNIKHLITLTHILFPIFIGVLIGGMVTDSVRTIVWGIILIVIDIIVGINLQVAVDEKEKTKKSWDDMSSTEKLNYIKSLDEEEKAIPSNNYGILCEKETCVNFHRAFYQLKEYKNGIKIRGMGDIMFNEAGVLLLMLCSEMDHAPTPEMLGGLKSISAYDGENGIILYGFDNFKFKTGELAAILLVYHNGRIRFFTLELGYSGIFLCEYSGYSHINHGYADVKNISAEIKRILNKH